MTEVVFYNKHARISLDPIRCVDKFRLGKKMGTIDAKLWHPVLIEMAGLRHHTTLNRTPRQRSFHQQALPFKMSRIRLIFTPASRQYIFPLPPHKQ